MRFSKLLVPVLRTACTSLLLVLAVASGLVCRAEAAPTPAPSASPATATPSPAAIVAPTGAMDTWRINAGVAGGWASGDRVRITRQGRVVGEAIVLKVAPGSADIVVAGAAAGGLQRGDRVEFLRRRPPLPKESATGAGKHAAPRPGGGSAPAAGEAPTDWKEVGKVEGLLGDDWMMRRTRSCRAWVRKGDLAYSRGVVDSLDASYDANREFMGFDIRTPIDFYFFPLEAPAHKQPRFSARLSRSTRAAGVALSDLGCCVINLGNWRTGSHREPWESEQVCRHEMNHIFAFYARREDRMHSWEWLFEALAHTIEDTAKPASSRIDGAAMRSYMTGCKGADMRWSSVIRDRNNDDLEQYRDYERILMSIIYFMRDKYGPDIVARVMRGAAQGGDVEDAFVRACGKGTKELEAEWRAFYGIQ